MKLTLDRGLKSYDIEDAVGSAIKASEQRMKKHTAVYADTRRGLAPGQQA